MSSSLLKSIFGGNAEEKESVELFDKSVVLPERPHHQPVPRKPTEERNQEKKEESTTYKDATVRESTSAVKSEMKDKKRTDKKRKSTGNSEVPQKERKKSKKTENNDSRDSEEVEANEEKEEDDEGVKDSESVDDRTIFVGNLPLATTTRKSLVALFKDCGKVTSARLRSVPVKGIKLPQSRAGDQRFMKKVCVNTHQLDEDSFKNTVQGYVVFESVDSVSKALEKNNTIKVEGRSIRVDKVTPTVDPSRSVFVGGLPYAADEATLQEHFVNGCDFDLGDVEGVRIVRDKESFQCKGFGYVLFREKNMVPTALKLHDSIYMNKPLRVSVCGKRFKGKKGQRDAAKPKYNLSQPNEKMTTGAFRRIIAKQQIEAADIHKRKRGEKKKSSATKAAAGGLSRRVVVDKKVKKKIKKIQKRIDKGMGKTKKG